MSRERIDKDVISPEAVILRNDTVNVSNSLSKQLIKNSIFFSACVIGAATSAISMDNINIDSSTMSQNVSYDSGYSYIKLPTIEFLHDDSENNSSNHRSIEYDINTYTSDVVSQQIIFGLRKEMAIMKNKLENSIPVHTMVYMVGSSMVGTFSAMLLFLRFALRIYVIDPYYLICALIISITLFATATVSLKDWKRFLNEG